MIVSAALKYAHIILSMPKPARHHDVLHQLYGMLEDASGPADDRIEETQSECIQGFIDDQGNFLDRETAYTHAISCGQGTPRRDHRIANGFNCYQGIELFSEDLW